MTAKLFWRRLRLAQGFASRLDQPEWLDLGYGTLNEVAANLNDMDRINHYLGGLPAVTRHLQPRISQARQRRATTEPMRLADLGTGSAEIPLALARWAQHRHLRLHIIAIDWGERQVQIA